MKVRFKNPPINELADQNPHESKVRRQADPLHFESTGLSLGDSDFSIAERRFDCKMHCRYASGIHEV